MGIGASAMIYPAFTLGTTVYFLSGVESVTRSKISVISGYSMKPGEWEITYRVEGMADLFTEDALYRSSIDAFAALSLPSSALGGV
jgi:hypothetical protein